MVNEKAIKQSFKAVKQDMESMKDEVAFLVKRIASLESNLIKKAIENQLTKTSKSKKKTSKKI